MSAPMVGNLDVRAREAAGTTQLPPTSTRYRIVEACVHLALCLLETAEARQSLATIATNIVQTRQGLPSTGSRRHPPKNKHIYKDSLSNMPYWIDRFLQQMRGNFPPILISADVYGEAEAEKYDWGQDMAQYIAGYGAGVLHMSESLISNMTFVRQQPPGIARNGYDLFKFQLTISVAHEIVHFLTGFITGDARPNTPQAISAAPYDREPEGEAGRYWESILLGGFVECWSSPSDPLGFRQAGLPYLFTPGGHDKAIGLEVDMSYVEEILNEQFTFPIRVYSNSRPMTRAQLKSKKSQETTILRNDKASKAAGRAQSPGQAGADTSVRYRKIIPSSGYGFPERGGADRRYYR